MINYSFQENHIAIKVKAHDEIVIPYENWLEHIQDVATFNVINDLIVNGNASQEDDLTVTIPYEDISSLDDFEYKTLKLPDPYPYDIYIDISGSGLKDTALKLKYSFQDFAHGNGSGNRLYTESQRVGAYLKGETNYLLKSDQFILLKQITEFNSKQFTTPNEVLKSIGRIQELAAIPNVVLSRILVETEIVLPGKFKIDIVKVGDDKYRIKPVLDKVDEESFNKRFNVFSGIRPEYHFREGQKKKRIIIDNELNESESSLETELVKVKRKPVLNTDEINEIYNSPTKFWDSDIVDLDDFGDRVVELGIYKPKFYPFISPYKSQWIPGIAIEDKNEGTRLIKIKNFDELNKLKDSYNESLKKEKGTVSFKNEELDIKTVPAIIHNAEEQLKRPNEPITDKRQEEKKDERQTKVLIIKENTDEFEYIEDRKTITDVSYKFQKISNLSDGIQLKDHQRDGVAWLQTLFDPPHSSPGVLLADDMGLGKTLQVLYFIEWIFQKGITKPILIIAPVSLLENWQNEYEKFFSIPSFNIEILYGSNVKNYIIKGNKEKTIKNLSKQSIYLTTYETLRKQQIPMAMIHWGVAVLDEAQKIKTPGTLVTNSAKALMADFKIAMTGTPVENSLMDIWCIVDFCTPGLLDSAKSFSNKYQKPLKKEDTDFEQLSANLRDEIGSSLMRRMKKDVAKDLPSIDYISHKDEMDNEQYEIYKAELSNIEALKTTSENSNPVLQGIFNLRSISDHPYLKHYQLENIPSSELLESSAKLKRTMSLLEEIKLRDEKAIVFTENKSMQRVLRRVIREKFQINSSIINGETPTSKSKNNKTKLSRQQEIDKYQAVEGFSVIIMSPIAAGFGLNITEANHVIHYTRHWNPAKEQQATDRAYRIGQKKDVNVHYPMAIAPNDELKTFDIVLDKLLNRKSNLASSTLFPTEQIEIDQKEFLNSIGGIEHTSEILIKDIEGLDKLQPLVFEAAVAILLEKKFDGRTLLTPQTNDKGADIIFLGENNNLLIQVKQSSTKLGISSGQEIKYALPEYTKKYNQTFQPQVITNNYFNNNAIELAEQNSIVLIDRDLIKEWIREHPLNMDEIDSKLDDRI